MLLPPVKFISPGDVRRHVVDYSGFLDTTETLTSKTISTSHADATIVSSSISSDGKSLIYLVALSVASVQTTFNVIIEAVTSLSQEKNDHMRFDVVAS